VTTPTFGRSYKMDVLRNVPLFRGLSQNHLGAIAKYTDAFQARRGTALTKQGQHGQEAFVIVDGKARVEVGGKTVAKLGAGDFIGELSLIDGKPRTARQCSRPPGEAARDALRAATAGRSRPHPLAQDSSHRPRLLGGAPSRYMYFSQASLCSIAGFTGGCRCPRTCRRRPCLRSAPRCWDRSRSRYRCPGG
jgi:hypothetical protein